MAEGILTSNSNLKRSAVVWTIHNMEHASMYLEQLKDSSCSFTDLHVVTSVSHCGLEDLCKGLSRSKTIQRLKLELIECNDDGAAHIAYLMAKNQHLKWLEIAANNFGGRAAQVLSGALQNSTLAEFSLSATQLDNHDRQVGDEGARYFGMCLRSNPALKSFALKQNGVFSEGLYMILDGMRTNNILCSLDLSSNPLDSRGAAAIGNFLTKTHTLEQLVLDDMTQFDGSSVREIAVGIAKNTSLKVLSLRSCSISTVGGKHLVSALSQHPSLTELRLCGNVQRGSLAVDFLCRMLKKNPRLSVLYLSNCGLGDDGAAHLADLLQDGGSLAVLAIKRNDIGDAGAIQLAEALMKNNTLTELAIEGNRFSVNAVREFTNCLRYNTVLRVFTLDPVPVSLDSNVNAGVLDALLEKNAELAQSRLTLNELQKENSQLRLENAQLKETVKSLHGLY